jgi:hypothetical protein
VEEFNVTLWMIQLIIVLAAFAGSTVREFLRDLTE